MDPRTPVGLLARLEDPLDPCPQTPVLSSSTALPAIDPRVVSRPRHPVAPAQRLYAKPVPFRLDERENGCLCAEQNRMAFFRISCSSRSNAYRRFSVEY